MRLLTEEDIILFNLFAIQESGGFGHALCPDKSLESCLKRVENHIEYNNLSDPYEIAAFYAEAIARGHIFIDANKRTAFYTMAYFLILNNIEHGYPLEYEPFINIFVDLADKKIDHKTLAELLKTLALK
jgi:death-on-curing protein